MSEVTAALWQAKAIASPARYPQGNFLLRIEHLRYVSLSSSGRENARARIGVQIQLRCYDLEDTNEGWIKYAGGWLQDKYLHPKCAGVSEEEVGVNYECNVRLIVRSLVILAVVGVRLEPAIVVRVFQA